MCLDISKMPGLVQTFGSILAVLVLSDLRFCSPNINPTNGCHAKIYEQLLLEDFAFVIIGPRAS